MRDNDITAGGAVVAVLLADGWHRIIRGSFSVGPLNLGVGVDPSVPGFWFEEADADSPNRLTVLAGPLDSIIAVRQVPPAVRRIGDRDRAWAALSGHRADQTARLPVRAGR
jgi:hypothetical protein